MQYSFRGRVHRESSRSELRSDAIKLLRARQAEITQGRVGPDAERVSFSDLAQMYLDDYRLNGRKSGDRARQIVGHLREFFGELQAMDITPERATAYIRSRLQGSRTAKPATIRCEVAALGRMFTLAYRAGRVPLRPPFPSIEVRNTRTGFFEEHELLSVLNYVPAYLRPFAESAYLTGWRRNELRNLTWRQVDFVAGVVRLEPGTTKNEEGRTFPFEALPRLAAVLHEQRAMTTELERKTGTIIPWVFHREGRQVGDYRDSWNTACRKAGVPGKLVHDLRRTAVRNLERAGVPRSVAMKLTGHKTENVYRRYAIVSEADLSDGVRKLASLHERLGEIGTRRVLPISGSDSERTGTLVAHSSTRQGDSVDAKVPQVHAIPTHSGALVAHLHWRPQRDSNSCCRRERAVS